MWTTYQVGRRAAASTALCAGLLIEVASAQTPTTGCNPTDSKTVSCTQTTSKNDCRQYRNSKNSYPTNGGYDTLRDHQLARTQLGYWNCCGLRSRRQAGYRCSDRH